NAAQPRSHDIVKTTGTILPRAERPGLAVLRFTNTTPKERAINFQPWEYGIAALLITDLEETAMFNIVDRERINDILKEIRLQKSGLVDPNSAVAIGKLVAAKYILTGTFMEMKGQLKISGQVYSVEKGIQLGATSVTGKTENFFLLEKDLFTKVTHIMGVVLDDEKQNKILNTFETKSVYASLKNYAGEIALMMAAELKKVGKAEESDRLEKDAKLKFEEALEYDPDYERAKRNLVKLVMAIPMTL
ncbi:MAG TPA: CsgG/HfaB family protein, partial [Deltaproteobacteria bacterium]|nr:CsgG/HfaB family protein [Deltaproteobacteria bacterium]HXK47749.1 CsgG/HfaB family protein [Deltaproteobacteria bacterium]